MQFLLVCITGLQHVSYQGDEFLVSDLVIQLPGESVHLVRAQVAQPRLQVGLGKWSSRKVKDWIVQ